MRPSEFVATPHRIQANDIGGARYAPVLSAAPQVRKSAHLNPPALGDLRRRARARTSASRTRGQSLVEFTLILPIMLILLLLVGDFGRMFAAGITIESAARTASEVAAAEYLRAGAPIDYTEIHRHAWSSVCDEASTLPNAEPGGGGECEGLPTVVCVHDGVDAGCGNVYNDALGTAGCPAVAAGTSNAIATGGEAVPTKYVEVIVCYRFSTILQMTLPSIGGPLSSLGGDFFMERSRVFTVADY